MNQNPSMAGLASLVQSRGRNGDSMLVHMAPEEVAGLQSLALAAGGSLTLNPETGLYEANFLKKLLPTIIGAVLTPLTGGLINPFTAGLLVGGVETIRTGDLGRGLMAGLGAYGGAGLSTALAGTGAAAASGAGAEIAKQGAAAAAETAGTEAAKEAAKQAAMKEAAQKAVQDKIKTSMFGRLPEGVASFRNIGAGIGEIAGGGVGLGGIGGMGTAGAAFNALPGGMIGKAGLVTTAANALTPEMEMPGGAYNIDDSYYEGADYDPVTGTFRQGQWRKGYPGFPGYAEGGVLPRPNYDYPQAGITKSSYAPQLEYARPQEILDGYEAKIDPFTGEERFADGGPVGVSPGAIGGDPRIVLEPGPVILPTLQPQQPQALPPQQSLEQYYQSLLSAPQQQNYNPAFFDYMQSLNRYVTSPIAPPPRPPAPPPPPAAPPPPPTTPFNPKDFNIGNFRNLASAALRNVGVDFGPTDGRMVYDPVTGGFITPNAVTTPATTTQQNQYDQTQFDPNNFQLNPFVDGFDYTQFPGYQQDQFTEPSYDFAGGTQNFDMGDTPIQALQMGDMGGYGQQFQGFQPLATDFGSTYQAPAMQTPMFDAVAYAPQQTDFGGMGNYGLGALGTTYQAPAFQMPSYDFSAPAPDISTASFQAPMTTGADSTAATAPQFGFGNSDVLYGQPMLGGNEPNIFGFAEGGAIQKAAAGKLVTGDGDGMSDDIRANINGDQEARLADGEFVIPADVVSHLGNGSTDAGADRLYAMMDRIRKARTGRTRQAPEIDADKYLPA